MTRLPPPLPTDVLLRVLRLASTDGRMLLVLAGGLALLSAWGGDAVGALTGCLAAGLGAIELHGVQKLRRGQAVGLGWLVGSQLGLLVVILGYAGARLTQYDPDLWLHLIPPELQEALLAAGFAEPSWPSLLRQLNLALYGTVAAATVIYQGGMAWYYWRRQQAVRQALGEN